MKFIAFLLLSLLIQTNVALSSDNQELYLKRVSEVLENRKYTMIKKIASKIGVNDEEVEKNMTFKLENNEINVIGHVNGSYGVCEITGKIMITETAVAGKCINEQQRVSIIWP